LSYALEYGADVYFVRDRNAVNRALYEVDSNDVRILRPTPALDMRFGTSLRLLQWRRKRTRWRREMEMSLWKSTREALADYCIDPDVPLDVRNRLRGFRQSLSVRYEALEALEEVPVTAYVERTRVRHPIDARLHADVAPAAVAQAEAVGVRAGAKLVCVHARESGYKRGREIHDSRHKLSNRNDATRNARIETYFDAMERLVARGYTVVRVGDPSMDPLTMPGVVDLATHPQRTSLAELYCLFHSDFIVCGESGPLSVAYLTNTPVVTVNSTDPIGGYPMRRDGFYILKGVLDRVTGRRLPLRELFEEHYLDHLRDTKRFVYVDNTPAEIVALVDEALEWIDGRHVESEGQALYRAMATERSVALRDRMAYVRKHGPDRGFLGDGRVGRQYFEQYF
jgi:putative glycosyltransferase (TIGR04372 family)